MNDGRCRWQTAVALMSVVFLSVAAWPGPASAHCEATSGHCNIVSCDSNECIIGCPTSGDIIILGNVWTYSGGWTNRGIGVVLKTSGGSYVDWCASTQSTHLWTVRGDSGNDASGGWDTMRVATAAGETFSSGTVWVDNSIPYQDSYLFWGDAGDDTIYLCNDSTPTGAECPDDSNAARADGRSGSDVIYGSFGGDMIWGGGGDYDDTLMGFFALDQIWGGDGDDTIYGGDISDDLYGENGDDHIWGDEYGTSEYPSADLIYGGAGADTIRGGDGNDQIFGDDGSGTQEGDLGDTIWGDFGSDEVWGGPGADLLRGDDDDTEEAGDGDDSLYGQAGDDDLYGNAGCDYIVGGADPDECWCKDAGDSSTYTGDDYQCTSTHDCTDDCFSR